MQHFISYKKEISDFLISFLTHQKLELKDSHFSEDVFERLIPLATSGKMLRGSLLMNAYEKLTGKKYSQEALQAATALELAQTGFLIHDDIIDQDELRRGQPTLHHQYTQRSEQKKYQQPAHTGASLATCAGDLVFFLAYELLSGGLIKLFSQHFGLVALGEMHDVELALMNGEVITKESIFQMYLDKTASYTISLPLMAGAVLAEQGEEFVIQLNELGKTLGLIFQIKDDELGLFGDKQKTGKPVGADIREGKKTLYYYYLEKKAPGTFAENGVEEILSLMEKHQIVELVNNDLEKLEVNSQQQIKELRVVEFRKMLKEFSEVNLRREK
ncbi:MAG: polyprenyl synthetase family protein [Candidatus Pacebacteria bacterium]|jgi:geranylgeranyl diphosphate synthase, type I|nr:polyprenyl synthetase family protein [Candidatus Paceibacterota bacterium]MBT3511553.1 polyprenyl synthetase family protein [Candidatus Paceibacterota bacterium]MBT4004977.1 polyprenyl synthetase family protein [Candidatus Paceibacterota bacterium]MBT4358753.1 polyprenyl synthetase family protein [Candidatus Paceibacterota bacterium]MBT4680912.1 polyprenyl synthetase family protein [Candidatus Paceibacterota bacterium]